jgi:hypothetical protein
MLYNIYIYIYIYRALGQHHINYIYKYYRTVYAVLYLFGILYYVSSLHFRPVVPESWKYNQLIWKRTTSLKCFAGLTPQPQSQSTAFRAYIISVWSRRQGRKLCCKVVQTRAYFDLHRIIFRGLWWGQIFFVRETDAFRYTFGNYRSVVRSNPSMEPRGKHLLSTRGNPNTHNTHTCTLRHAKMEAWKIYHAWPRKLA